MKPYYLTCSVSSVSVWVDLESVLAITEVTHHDGGEEDHSRLSFSLVLAFQNTPLAINCYGPSEYLELTPITFLGRYNHKPFTEEMLVSFRNMHSDLLKAWMSRDHK